MANLNHEQNNQFNQMSKPNDGRSSNLISVDCFCISPFMHTCYLLLSINVFDVCYILVGKKNPAKLKKPHTLIPACTLA